MKTQETTLKRDASDAADAVDAALDERFTTRGSYRDTESLENSDTEDFSHSEKVGFNEAALDHADRAETRRETQARNF